MEDKEGHSTWTDCTIRQSYLGPYLGPKILREGPRNMGWGHRSPQEAKLVTVPQRTLPRGKIRKMVPPESPGSLVSSTLSPLILPSAPVCHPCPWPVPSTWVSCTPITPLPPPSGPPSPPELQFLSLSPSHKSWITKLSCLFLSHSMPSQPTAICCPLPPPCPLSSSQPSQGH